MLARWTSLAIAASLIGGCAQISANTELRTVPVSGAPPLVIERRVVERQVEARWLQRGDTLAIELLEHRRCQVVEHVADCDRCRDLKYEAEQTADAESDTETSEG